MRAQPRPYRQCQYDGSVHTRGVWHPGDQVLVPLSEVVALLRSAPQRVWSEDDADSAESRSARAYNYALLVAANTVEATFGNDQSPEGAPSP